MKKTGIVFALFAIVLTTGAGARAQRPSLKTSLVTQGPVTQAPDLSKLNIDKILQQLQTTKVQPSSEETSLQVVAEFLQLSPSQISELEQFAANAPGEASAAFPERAGFDPTVGSHAEFRRKPGAGRNRSNPNPRVAAADGAGATAFLTQFIATLVPEQLQRLQAVQIAVQLQPILPVFQSIFLF